MDIEQLRLILEAAAAAGDGATKVVFVWFAYKFFGTLIHYGLFGGLFFGAYKAITKLIESFAFAERIRIALGVDYFSDSKKNTVVSYIRQHPPG